MTVLDDDTLFWGAFMAQLAHQIGGPVATVNGFTHMLLRGDLDDERRGECLERLRDEGGDPLIGFVKLLRLASATSLGKWHALRTHSSTVNARQIADQAQTSLAEEYDMRVTVSGEGVAVLAEEWVADGFANIAFKIAHHLSFRMAEEAKGLKIKVDGAEIAVGPVPADDGLRRFVTGDDPESWTAGLAVRVIRGLGGSVGLDGDALKLRFPEPHSSEAAA